MGQLSEYVQYFMHVFDLRLRSKDKQDPQCLDVESNESIYFEELPLSNGITS